MSDWGTVIDIKEQSSLSDFLSGKTFDDERDFLETLEDHLFWKHIEEWDVWDYIEVAELQNLLNDKIWK